MLLLSSRTITTVAFRMEKTRVEETGEKWGTQREITTYSDSKIETKIDEKKHGKN